MKRFLCNFMVFVLALTWLCLSMENDLKVHVMLSSLILGWFIRPLLKSIVYLWDDKE